MMPENVQKAFSVYIRKRAFNSKDIHIPGILEKKTATDIVLNTGNDETRYVFDQIFGSDSTQFEIYDIAVRPLLQHSHTGYNSVILAYGASGTGKTYTLLGEESKKVASFEATTLGILPRVMHQLFEYIEDKDLDQEIFVSFGEVYRNKLQDLMVVGDETSCGVLIDKEVENLEDLTESVVSNMLEFDELLSVANLDQDTSNCTRNKSEVHTIYSIIIRDKYNKKSTIGTMTILDLSDSQNLGDIPHAYFLEERLSPSGQSLLSIVRLFHAWAQDDDTLPFEDSKVTSLLQKKIDNKTKAALIATISPSADTIDETQDTLDYADQARSARNHFGRIQKPFEELISIEHDIELLHEELTELVEREEFAQPRRISTSTRRSTKLQNFFDNCQMVEEDCLVAIQRCDDLLDNMLTSIHSDVYSSENYERQAKQFVDKKGEIFVILTKVARCRDRAFNLLFNCPQEQELTIKIRHTYSNYDQSSPRMPTFVKKLWYPELLSSSDSTTDSDTNVENIGVITRILQEQENEIPQPSASTVDDETSEKDNPQPTAPSLDENPPASAVDDKTSEKDNPQPTVNHSTANSQPDDEGVNVVVHDASTEAEGKQLKVEEQYDSLAQKPLTYVLHRDDVIHLVFDKRRIDEQRSSLDMEQAQLINLEDASSSDSDYIIEEIETGQLTEDSCIFLRVKYGNSEDTSSSGSHEKIYKDYPEKVQNLYEEVIGGLMGTYSQEGSEKIRQEEAGVELFQRKVQEAQGRHTSWEFQDSWTQPEGTSTSDSDKGTGNFGSKCFSSQELTAEEISTNGAADQPKTVQNEEERFQQDSAEPGRRSTADCDENVEMIAPLLSIKEKLARKPATPEDILSTDRDTCEEIAIDPFLELQKTEKSLDLNQQYRSDQTKDKAFKTSDDSDFVGQSSGMRKRAFELAILGEGSTTDNDDICGDVAFVPSFHELHGSRMCYDLSEEECRYAAGDSGGLEEVVVGSSLELPVLEEHSQESTAEETSKDDAADELETLQNVEERSQDNSAEPGQRSPADDIVDIFAPPSFRRRKLARESVTSEDRPPTDSDICKEAAVAPFLELQKIEKRLDLNQPDTSTQPEGKSSTDSDGIKKIFVCPASRMKERALELASHGEGSTTSSDDIVEYVAPVLSIIEVQESKKCYDLREQEPGSPAVDSGNFEEVDTTPSVMLTKLEGEPTKPKDKYPAKSGDSGDEVAAPESIEPEGVDEINRDVPEAVSEVQKLDASQKYNHAST